MPALNIVIYNGVGYSSFSCVVKWNRRGCCHRFGAHLVFASFPQRSLSRRNALPYEICLRCWFLSSNAHQPRSTEFEGKCLLSICRAFVANIVEPEFGGRVFSTFITENVHTNKSLVKGPNEVSSKNGWHTYWLYVFCTCTIFCTEKMFKESSFIGQYLSFFSI